MLIVEVDCFDPVPSTDSFEKLQWSSKVLFCRQSITVFKTILAMLTPNHEIDLVWKTIVDNSKQNSISNHKLDKNFRLILTSLAEAYNNAPHWTIRRQILSIMAYDLPFSTIRMFIPRLTADRFNMARRHANFEGKGIIVDDTRAPTIHYDDCQLEHFIEFIVSPHICIDLPFGESKLQLSTGKTLLIPLTIRNLAP